MIQCKRDCITVNGTGYVVNGTGYRQFKRYWIIVNDMVLTVLDTGSLSGTGLVLTLLDTGSLKGTGYGVNGTGYGVNGTGYRQFIRY